jgi:hypothetical protein
VREERPKPAGPDHRQNGGEDRGYDENPGFPESTLHITVIDRFEKQSNTTVILECRYPA